jgi:ubiquinone/menaquinone biosynthesis C-methylase UbiE
MSPHGVDLSPEMVRVARRDHPGFPFEVGDLRNLPFGDATLAGVVCWYSLMYLAPDDRPAAFAELARVVRPGGHLTTAFKMGDDTVRRGGRTVGVEFDIWWLSHAELTRRLTDAGFAVVFNAERPADPDEVQPQGYLIARRLDDAVRTTVRR